jgi:hypothetical protein
MIASGCRLEQDVHTVQRTTPQALLLRVDPKILAGIADNLAGDCDAEQLQDRLVTLTGDGGLQNTQLLADLPR